MTNHFDQSLKVTAEVLDTDFVRVIVRIRPGWQWWTCPPARRLRRLAQATARDAGRILVPGEERTEARMHPHWCFLYRIQPITTTERES